MTNTRLKKVESSNQQKEPIEEPKAQKIPESFSTNTSSEDDLTKKRKMILTGISAGVGVAGIIAALLLFFGPYSPFGVKSNEKPVKVEVVQNLPPPPVEEKKTVPLPQPVIVEKAPPIIAAAPKVEKTKENLIVPPKEKVEVKKVINKGFSESSYKYDIQNGGPVIRVQSNKKIIVSRDPDFKKIYLNGSSNTSGNYRISVPPPGPIYWKEDGKAVHKITIIPPVSSGLYTEIPNRLKINDMIKWTVTGKVSFYRIEVSNDLEFLNRVKVFSTTKTSFPVEKIGIGKWFIKISALNLQSGSWDSTKVYSVDIGESAVVPATESSSEPAQLEDTNVSNETKDAKKDTSIDETKKPVEIVNPVEATVPEQNDSEKIDSEKIDSEKIDSEKIDSEIIDADKQSQ